MKAYILWVEGEDDAGQAIVFANTTKEAKKQVYGHDGLAEALEGGWIALRARRAVQYDDMENDRNAVALTQWKDGWQWFDRFDMPDPDIATDKDFLEWYESSK